MSTRANVGSRLETKTSFIKELIGDIQKGEIKIPQFQRKFVWKETQALNLLDSIVNNYPVGSILLWRTNTKLAVERNIGDFKLPETDDHSPTDYVLDGQQRITVIYSCLGAPEGEPGFAAGYDLKKEEFIHLSPENEAPQIFPMRLLFDTTKLLNFRTGLQTQSDSVVHQKRLDELLEAFSGYKLPVVVLKDLTVEEVCPIFERINSSGTKLSMYDLMVAATWSPNFDLNDVSEQLAVSLEAKGFETIEPGAILKCLSAIQLDGLKKDQLLRLREVLAPEMHDLVEQTKAALLRAVDLLSTEFRIHSWDFLPYEAVLVILCYICAKLPKVDASQLGRLRQWLWRSAFSERYRVGGEGFVSRDLAKVLAFVRDGGDPSVFGEAPASGQIVQATFRANNSRSRAFILALASMNPRNLTNGALIDTADALSQFNKKQFHHIFPKAYLAGAGIDGEPNSLANICMLAASENNKVSDADPHKYIPVLIYDHPTDAELVLASNFMPDSNTTDYKMIPYDVFVDERGRLLADHIADLCDGKVQ